MQIHVQRRDPILHVSLQGRFDAVGSREIETQLMPSLQPGDRYLILDMVQVEYLSSAGLRIVMALHKRLLKEGGSIAITRLQPYCLGVFDVAGFTSAFPIFETNAEAEDFLQDMIRERSLAEGWDRLETAGLDCGSFRFIPQPAAHGAVEVLGHVNDVLYCRITPDHLCSKHFFSTEYSIGLGGLGDRLSDYFPIMGEMITIGGTMVWLPTDGNDTPDFLIPRVDTGQVTIRTGFNASIAGGFNELIVFQSRSQDGVTVDELYKALYRLAKERRQDYRGVLGLAVLAQLPFVYGAGIKQSPILERAPKNGEMILHPSNQKDWFDFDSEPRHRGVTGLICGLGVDLTADLSHYNQDEFNSVFYIHPTHHETQPVLLHNHAVMFDPLPFPERPVNFDREIKNVVEQGEFIDMRHLLDCSTIGQALIGVSYIQEFRRDPKGFRGI